MQFDNRKAFKCKATRRKSQKKLLNPPGKKIKNQKPKRKAVSKDIRIALNTIKQSLSMVTKSGINIKTEEEDTEEFYQITVKIPKKKS